MTQTRTRPNQTNYQPLRKKAAIISFLVGMLMLAMKMGGYVITNSAAILSDAMESIVHVIATGVALYSVILSARPADTTHPYGYGKIEYFSAGMEGGLIVVAAIAICYEAVRDIIFGNELKSLDVGVLVVAAAGAINLLLGFYLVRTGKKTNSLTLVADGKHVLTDSYTSIGVLIGLILVTLTHFTLLDPIFAIAVALNILYTGIKLMRESARGLMNVADQETLARALNAIQKGRTDDMIDVHWLRAWSSGPEKFVDFHLTLPYYLQLKQTHDIQDDIQEMMWEEFDGETQVMVHLDPCNVACCIFCYKADCTARKTERTIDHPITIQTVQREPFYQQLGKQAQQG